MVALIALKAIITNFHQGAANSMFRSLLISLWCPIACVLFALTVSPTNAESDLETLEVLSEGLRAWSNASSFVASYEVKTERASTMEQAVAGNYDRRGGEPENPDLATQQGKICKLGSLVRYTEFFEGGPQEIGPPPGHIAKPGVRYFRNRAHDEVTDGRLQIRYTPAKDDGGGKLFIETRDDRLGASVFAGPSTKGSLSPFGLSGTMASEVLDKIRRDVEQGADLKIDRKRSDGYVEVTSTSEKAGSTKVTRAVIWTQPELPVLTEYEISSRRNGKTSTARYLMSEFVDCGPSKIARTVKRITSTGADRPLRVQVWHSPDLGDREPVKADFVVTVPKTVSLGGVKALPPSALSDGSFDITQFSEANLKGPGLADSTQAAPSSSLTGLRLMFLVINLVVACLLFAIVLFKRKRRASA